MISEFFLTLSYLFLIFGSVGMVLFATQFPLSKIWELKYDSHRILGLNGQRLWLLSWTFIICGTSLQLVNHWVPKRPTQVTSSIMANVLEVNKIILTDQDGKVRAVLGPTNPGLSAESVTHPARFATPSQYWGLHLFASNGQSTAALLSTEENGWLFVADKATMSRADLSVGKGSARLSLSATAQSQEEGRREDDEFSRLLNQAKTVEERAKAYKARSPADLNAQLLLWKDQSSFTLSEKGVPRVVLGRTGLQRQDKTVEQLPLSSVIILDKTGQLLWRAP